MQYGEPGARPAWAEDVATATSPFAKVPEVGLELVRLTREVKIQETLVTC